MLLGEQDRSLWDSSELGAGRELLDEALALRGRGPYVLQAAIASLQSEDPIDWPEVVELYVRLAELTGSPVVELNRAVAVAQTGRPRRRSRSWTGSSSATIPTCTRREASCCDVWAGSRRPGAAYASCPRANTL